jgi:hypothetical protein
VQDIQSWDDIIGDIGDGHPSHQWAPPQNQIYQGFLQDGEDLP